MLKKQTVWLLTMVSLMVVLSVYYLMSDKEDLAYIVTEEETFEETTNQNEHLDIPDSGVEVDQFSEVVPNELFTTIRMELEDERNIKKDRLKEVLASGNSTTSEINNALNEINQIESVTTKETILQETILAAEETYEDVLVRVEEEKAHVHVITDSMTREQAVNIMQMVKDELGEIVVDVNFQAITK